MRVKELTDDQLKIIAEEVPEYLCQVLPNKLATMNPDWIFEHFPDQILSLNPNWFYHGDGYHNRYEWLINNNRLIDLITLSYLSSQSSHDEFSKGIEWVATYHPECFTVDNVQASGAYVNARYIEYLVKYNPNWLADIYPAVFQRYDCDKYKQHSIVPDDIIDLFNNRKIASFGKMENEKFNADIKTINL